MQKPEISIGVAIYNNASNFKNLIHSIRATDASSRRAQFLVYNDGSSISDVDAEAREFCEAHSVWYGSGLKNRGVPYAWNRLTEVAAADIVVILNDDVRACEPGIIDQLIYLFSANPRLGIVYWSQKRIQPVTGVNLGLTSDSIRARAFAFGHPCLRHNFCGAFFAFRKTVWRDIAQPDGSIGFWEDLTAYGEELDFSSEVQSRGFFILQLSATYKHLHSQTFRQNPHQQLRTILSAYLPMNEFASYARRTTSEIESPSPNRILRMRRTLAKFLRPGPRKRLAIGKLEYSMALLNKKWANRAVIGVPAPVYFERLLKNGFPAALAEALAAGVFSLPQKINYLSDETRPLSIESTECLDSGATSLV